MGTSGRLRAASAASASSTPHSKQHSPTTDPAYASEESTGTPTPTPTAPGLHDCALSICTPPPAPQLGKPPSGRPSRMQRTAMGQEGSATPQRLAVPQSAPHATSPSFELSAQISTTGLDAPPASQPMLIRTSQSEVGLPQSQPVLHSAARSEVIMPPAQPVLHHAAQSEVALFSSEGRQSARGHCVPTLLPCVSVPTRTLQHLRQQLSDSGTVPVPSVRSACPDALSCALRSLGCMERSVKVYCIPPPLSGLLFVRCTCRSQ